MASHARQREGGRGMTAPKRILVVCTGNVARSPAMEILLRHYRPDLRVTSAAVGERARDGRPMARPMRTRMAQLGLATAAARHRSRTFATALRSGDNPQLVLAMASNHVARLEALQFDDAPVRMIGPIADPAFGGEPAYDRALQQLLVAVSELAAEL